MAGRSSRRCADVRPGIGMPIYSCVSGEWRAGIVTNVKLNTNGSLEEPFVEWLDGRRSRWVLLWAWQIGPGGETAGQQPQPPSAPSSQPHQQAPQNLPALSLLPSGTGGEESGGGVRRLPQWNVQPPQYGQLLRRSRKRQVVACDPDVPFPCVVDSKRLQLGQAALETGGVRAMELEPGAKLTPAETEAGLGSAALAPALAVGAVAGSRGDRVGEPEGEPEGEAAGEAEVGSDGDSDATEEATEDIVEHGGGCDGGEYGGEGGVSRVEGAVRDCGEVGSGRDGPGRLALVSTSRSGCIVPGCTDGTAEGRAHPIIKGMRVCDAHHASLLTLPQRSSLGSCAVAKDWGVCWSRGCQRGFSRPCCLCGEEGGARSGCGEAGCTAQLHAECRELLKRRVMRGEQWGTVRDESAVVPRSSVGRRLTVW